MTQPDSRVLANMPPYGRQYDLVENFTSGAIGVVLLLSVVGRAIFGLHSIGWQVVIALISLAIGIPHGAVDHLITLPKSSKLKFALFIIGYVGIAALAVLAILKWNVIGFRFVVVMSFLHFGFGDSAFISEKSLGEFSAWEKIFYALSAGALPVLIPLVSTQSVQALSHVNYTLIGWAGGQERNIKIAVWGISLLSTLFLIAHRRLRQVLDLLLLSGLALFTPPLICFAAYFGLWHALRHTARLTRLLPPAPKPFRSAFLKGLPALVGTFLFATAIGLFRHASLTSSLLWYVLVVVWALTVPHMIATSRFDYISLKKNRND